MDIQVTISEAVNGFSLTEENQQGNNWNTKVFVFTNLSQVVKHIKKIYSPKAKDDIPF